MRKGTCELCGCRIRLGAVEQHHVVPTNITEQAGMPESQILILCGNCHREAHTWYSTKVADMTYDSKTKLFRAKSCLEMVKEYQSVFSSFAKYKKEQRKAG